MEVWKDIPGYEGYYQASTEGRVRSLSRIRMDGAYKPGKVLNKNRLRDGYEQVALCKDRKRDYEKVHRLVALTFIPNPDNKPQVNHKNGIKHDNRLENLEWVTPRENTMHAYNVLGIKHPHPPRGTPSKQRKFTDEQVEAIRKDPRTRTAIAKDYGVCEQTICNIKLGYYYIVPSGKRKRT